MAKTVAISSFWDLESPSIVVTMGINAKIDVNSGKIKSSRRLESIVRVYISFRIRV